MKLSSSFSAVLKIAQQYERCGLNGKESSSVLVDAGLMARELIHIAQLIEQREASATKARGE